MLLRAAEDELDNMKKQGKTLEVLQSELDSIKKKEEERSKLLQEAAQTQEELQQKLVEIASLQKDLQAKGAPAVADPKSDAVELQEYLRNKLGPLKAGPAASLSLQESNARRSVIMQNAAVRQTALAGELADKARMQKEQQQLQSLAEEVERLREQGKETAKVQEELSEMRDKTFNKNKLLVEAAILQDAMKAKLTEIARLEKESQRLRDENHRKSLLLREAKGVKVRSKGEGGGGGLLFTHSTLGPTGDAAVQAQSTRH